MDGTGAPEDLFDSTDGVVLPTGVALDVAGGKVYWTDFTTQKVQRGNMDGTGAPEDLFDSTDGLISPFRVAITPTIFTPAQDIQNVIDVLQDIVDSNPGTLLAEALEDAIATLETALDALADEPPDSQAAAGDIEAAVGEIEKTVDDGLLDPVQGAEFMDLLAGIAKQIAEDALDQAIAGGGDQEKIDEAQLALEDGDLLRASEAFVDAVNAYKDALEEAERALP
jgi:hypothetical protein